jgi:hypothetical protein
MGVRRDVAHGDRVVARLFHSDRLQKLANNLRAIVQTVRSGADAFGDAGAHAAAKEAIGQLDTVLGAIAGVSADADKLNPRDRAAVAYVRAFPELAEEADKLLKEAGRARLVPFAMAREHYRLAVKGFEDELALKILRSVLRGPIQSLRPFQK